jgi:hypothetical protein
MLAEQFQIGRLYFIGGYLDPQRKHPCEIRPVIFLGTEPLEDDDGEERIRYVFESLEAWFDRRGVGSPQPDDLEYIDGPADITLVMDIDGLIGELVELKSRLR